jgi:hypothetical protein
VCGFSAFIRAVGIVVIVPVPVSVRERIFPFYIAVV